MADISLDISGVRELRKALKDLPANMQKRIFKVSVDSGLRVLRKAARTNARAVKDTGALAKSIDIKSKVYPSGFTYGAVGPDRSKSYPAPAHRKTKSGTIRPANYAHLVEDGTSRTAAKPFLRPAFESSGETAMSAMAAGISKGLDREVKKLERKAAKK